MRIWRSIALSLATVVSVMILAVSAADTHAVDEREYLDRGRNVQSDGETVVWATHQRLAFAERLESGERISLRREARGANVPDVSGDLIEWLDGDGRGGGLAGHDLEIRGMYWDEQWNDGETRRVSTIDLADPEQNEVFIEPETGLRTQYFERACFELHPDNPVEHRVPLGRLGADLLEQLDW